MIINVILVRGYYSGLFVLYWLEFKLKFDFNNNKE